MKKYLYPIMAGVALLAVGCSDNDSDSTPGAETGSGNASVDASAVHAVTSSSLADISTDKAVYAPGEAVKFTCAGIPAGATVRYRQGADVIGESAVSGSTWTWQPPTTDFTGYMVDVYTMADNRTEQILASIAVDVSSDWTHFPRYGFVATFDSSKLPSGVIEQEMAYLNRCHINGVQFQDWHNKHHWPLGGTRDNLLDVYQDIANRDVYTSVVKKYIEVQHQYGMKSMFYNLCFGALNDAESDGVKADWYAFSDQRHSTNDKHSLPSSWKSSIYVLDPANPEWQAYLAERNDEVYANLDFDGFHIDQLGDRGTLYDYYGGKLNLKRGYASFINAMKAAHPDKTLAFNAVASYAAESIIGTGNVSFCYNEVWSDQAQFYHLRDIIVENDGYSNNSLRTVFAAYMNYDKADRETGYMNLPGVVMTDAVMMALGGSHLELGDHMLCREYFPSTALQMTDELKEAMIRYYDFQTAYQNLLRGTSTSSEVSPSVSASGVNVCSWPPRQGYITTYSRDVDGKRVVNLLNFVNIDNLSWRDLDGTREAPQEFTSLPMTITMPRAISKLWVASPDYNGGVAQELPFNQVNGVISFTLPALNYWTMIVIE